LVFLGFAQARVGKVSFSVALALVCECEERADDSRVRLNRFDGHS